METPVLAEMYAVIYPCIKENKMIGFNFAGGKGFELCYPTGYVVSIQPYNIAKEGMFDSTTVNVLVTKMITKDHIENVSIDIMEHMQYRPLYIEMKQQMFMKVEPLLLTRILFTVSKMEVH